MRKYILALIAMLSVNLGLAVEGEKPAISTPKSSPNEGLHAYLASTPMSIRPSAIPGIRWKKGWVGFDANVILMRSKVQAGTLSGLFYFPPYAHKVAHYLAVGGKGWMHIKDLTNPVFAWRVGYGCEVSVTEEQFAFFRASYNISSSGEILTPFPSITLGYAF